MTKQQTNNSIRCLHKHQKWGMKDICLGCGKDVTLENNTESGKNFVAMSKKQKGENVNHE